MIEVVRLFVFWFESSKRQTAGVGDHFAAERRFRFFVMISLEFVKVFDLLLKTYLREIVFGTKQKSFCVEKCDGLQGCFSFGFESSKRQTALSDVSTFQHQKV